MQESSKTELNIKSISSSYKSRRQTQELKSQIIFSDQYIAKSNECDYSNASMIDITESEEFFEARQSFCHTSSIDIKSPLKSMLNIKHENECKNSEEKNNNKENVESKDKNYSTKMKNISLKPSRIFVIVFSEETGDIHIKELSSPKISTPLRKLQNEENKTKENSNSLMTSIDKHAFVLNTECVKTFETTDISKKCIKQKDYKEEIIATVTNVFTNALKNLSGKTVTTNISNATSNNISASLNSVLPSPIHNSTSIGCDEGSCSFEFQTSKQLNKDTGFSSTLVNDLLYKTCHENMSSLKIIQSSCQKRSKNWYKHIHGRPPILRMRNASCVLPKKAKQKYSTIEDGVFSLLHPLQLNKSTQTD